MESTGAARNATKQWEAKPLDDFRKRAELDVAGCREACRERSGAENDTAGCRGQPGGEPRGSLPVGEAYGRAFANGGFRRTVEVLRGRGANLDLARETAQAAWCRGWEHVSQLKDSTRVVAWVTSIAINMSRDEITKNRRFVPLPSAGYEIGIAPSVNVTILDLDVAIRGCPARQRALLEAVLAGRTVDELAAGLAVSTGAVHHRLSRARRALRRGMHAV